MNEAPFAATVRTAAGSLLTVRGDDADTFRARLAAAAAALTELTALEHATTATGRQAAPAAATAVPAPAPAPVLVPATSSHGMCVHGERTFREGTSQRGPWHAWLCAAPQGTPRDQQCQPVWANADGSPRQ